MIDSKVCCPVVSRTVLFVIMSFQLIFRICMTISYDQISKKTGGKSTLSRHSVMKRSSAWLCATEPERNCTNTATIRAKNSESLGAWFLAQRYSRQSRSNIWHCSTVRRSSNGQRSNTHIHRHT